MANVPPTDWAWPRLLDSLQRDIARLHETVEMMRRETAEVRERHREELDELIDQLRKVRAELEPILTERQKTAEARREMVWGWAGKGGWLILLAIGAAVYHFITKHLGVGHE